MLQTWGSWADISPKYVADRPVLERRTDPLSEVFGSMSIQEAVYMRLEATAPWGVRYLGDTGPRILFIFILSGEPFVLMDHPSSTVVDSKEVRKLAVDGVINYGGGGPLTTLVAGAFGMSTFGAPLISAILPRFLHLRLEQKRSHAFQCILGLLAAETAQPGIASSRLISCLYESLFVYAIRAYASSSAAPPKGWLAAMSDKHLSKAIQA